MQAFQSLFKHASNRCAVIGMIHAGALPGTPRNSMTVKELVKSACIEAETYLEAGVEGIIVENMHDIPYVTEKEIGPEITASMTSICTAVRRVLPNNFPCGVQILAGANRQALAVAQASNFDFIRAECFVYGHMADEGLMNACAGSLLRYRKHIGADDILIFTDIKKKHSSHSITADITIGETANAAEFFTSDAVIVTGTSTGIPADLSDIKCVRSNCSLPVIVGSGVEPKNWHCYSESANAAIIGSYFKHGGYWRNELDINKIKEFMKLAKS